MPDLTEQLSSILNDPAGMEKIKAMAQNLLGGEVAQAAVQTAPQPIDKPDNTLADIGALTKMAQMLNTRADDDRVRLLLALRPHLSHEKQLRVDKAVKMLKLLDLAPMLSQFGILEL